MASKSKKTEDGIEKKPEKTAPNSEDMKDAATEGASPSPDTPKASARGKAATTKKAATGTTAGTRKKSAAVKKADDEKGAASADEATAALLTEAVKKTTAAKRTTASKATIARKTATKAAAASDVGEKAPKGEEKMSEATPKREAARRTTAKKTSTKKAAVKEEGGAKQAATATDTEHKTKKADADEPLREVNPENESAVHTTENETSKLLGDGYPGAWWREDNKKSSAKAQTAESTQKEDETKQKEQP